MPYFRSRRGYRTVKRKSYPRRSTKYARRKTYSKRRKVAIRKYPGHTKQRQYAIPRLRLATTRQKTRLLRLRKDLEWTVAPEWTGVPNECLHLRFRANSVLNIIADAGTNQSGLPNNVWRANDPQYTAVGGQQQFPEGLELWQGQYYHFCVIASKITVIINSTDGTELHDPAKTPGPYQPALAFLTKFGTQTNIATIIGNNSTKEQISKVPFTTMAALPNQPNRTSGCKLSMGYSAKRFESVPSPMSASQLRGDLITPGASAQPVNHPNEQTFFSLGILPARGFAASTQDYMAPMQVQVKIEYSVVLSEPTPHQLAGVPPGPGLAAGAAAAAAAFAEGMATGADA